MATTIELIFTRPHGDPILKVSGDNDGFFDIQVNPATKEFVVAVSDGTLLLGSLEHGFRVEEVGRKPAIVNGMSVLMQGYIDWVFPGGLEWTTPASAAAYRAEEAAAMHAQDSELHISPASEEEEREERGLAERQRHFG